MTLEQEMEPAAPATDGSTVQGPAPEASPQPQEGQGRPYSLEFLSNVPGGLMEDQLRYIESNLGEILRKQDAKVTQVLQQSSARATEAEKALQGVVAAIDEAKVKDPVRHRAIMDVLEGNYGQNGVREADPITELSQRSKAGQKVGVSEFGDAVRQMIQREFQAQFDKTIKPLVQAHVSDQREQRVTEALRSEPRIPSDKRSDIVKFLSDNPNMTPNQAIYALYGPDLIARAQRETAALYTAGTLGEGDEEVPGGRKQFADPRAAGEAAYREVTEKLRQRRTT